MTPLRALDEQATQCELAQWMVARLGVFCYLKVAGQAGGAADVCALRQLYPFKGGGDADHAVTKDTEGLRDLTAMADAKKT